MSEKQLLLDCKALRARLPEVSDYCRRKNLRAEPHKYPKNLFKAQRHYSFNMEEYLAEIDETLRTLERKKCSDLEVAHQLKRVHQQLNVLINTAKSSKAKVWGQSLLDKLSDELTQSDASGLELLARQQQAPMDLDKARALEQCDKQLSRLRKLKRESQDERVRLGLESAIAEVEKEREKLSF